MLARRSASTWCAVAKQDQRSDAARAIRRLYSTARWRRLREAYFAEQPLCERCKQMEIIEEATVLHHKDGGHKGDETRFWSGPFEALCKPCHDRLGAMEDRGVEVVTFGVDGWPVD